MLAFLRCEVWLPADSGGANNVHRYLDALFYSFLDGNLRRKQRRRPTNYHDAPVAKGASYFVDAGDFKAYTRKIGPAPKVASGACYRLAYGIVLTRTCRAQRLPRPVPYYRDADTTFPQPSLRGLFCVVTGVQPYLSLKLIKHFYDINCQHMVHLRTHLERFGRIVGDSGEGYPGSRSTGVAG